MKRTPWIAMSLMLCASAVKAGSRPDWVDGTSRSYPRERYLVGIGMGDDRATASDRARSEISKIFTTNVNVTTNLHESESSSKQGAKTENSFSQAISQSLQTASKKVLEGVEVVESWKDGATMQQYALAVLDRSKALAAVKDKLDDFDRQAQQWKSSMDSASDKVGKVKAAMKLLALLKARVELNGEMRVLDPGGKTVPSPFDEAAVRAGAAKTVAELDVIVDIKEAK
ncbi:MAG: LPP20 family lipoprotein [Elusimicrobiota bacterium]